MVQLEFVSNRAAGRIPRTARNDNEAADLSYRNEARDLSPIEPRPEACLADLGRAARARLPVIFSTRLKPWLRFFQRHRSRYPGSKIWNYC